jgi:hypothetical protein
MWCPEHEPCVLSKPWTETEDHKPLLAFVNKTEVQRKKRESSRTEHEALQRSAIRNQKRQSCAQKSEGTRSGKLDNQTEPSIWKRRNPLLTILIVPSNDPCGNRIHKGKAGKWNSRSSSTSSMAWGTFEIRKARCWVNRICVGIVSRSLNMLSSRKAYDEFDLQVASGNKSHVIKL